MNDVEDGAEGDEPSSVSDRLYGGARILRAAFAFFVVVMLHSFTLASSLTPPLHGLVRSTVLVAVLSGVLFWAAVVLVRRARSRRPRAQRGRRIHPEDVLLSGAAAFGAALTLEWSLPSICAGNVGAFEIGCLAGAGLLAWGTLTFVRGDLRG